jgi:hypothetical protein
MVYAGIAPMDIDIPLVNRSDLHDLLKDTEYSQDIYDVLSTDEVVSELKKGLCNSL